MMLLLLVTLARADDPEADPAPPAPPASAPASESETEPATTPAAKATAEKSTAPSATPPLTLPSPPTPVRMDAPSIAPAITEIPFAPTPPPSIPSPADTDLPDPEPVPLASPNERLALERTEEGWRVVNADGRSLTSERFAELVGDIDYFIERDADLRRVRGARTGLYVGGGALLVGAVVAVAVDGPRAPDEDNYLVDPDNYGSYSQYTEARDNAEIEFEKDYGRYREGRWWSAAFCAASGGFAIVSAPLLGRDVRERRAHPDKVWTERRAKEMIERHNQAHGTGGTLSATLTPTGLVLTGTF